MTKLADRDIVEAYQKVCNGVSVRVVAKRLKVSHSTLIDRLSKKYGKNYLARKEETATVSILREYLDSKDQRLREAAALFLEQYFLAPKEESGNPFFTIREETARCWSENFIEINYNLLDTRKGKGVKKVC